MSTGTDGPTPSRAEALRRLEAAGRHLSDAVVLFHAHAAEAFGLGASETKALGYIQRFGPMSHRDLTERIGLKPASVTNMLDRLEAKGWIRREKSEEDGRRVLLSLVPEKTERFQAAVFGPLMTRLKDVYAGFETTELILIGRAFGAVATAQEAALRDIETLEQK